MTENEIKAMLKDIIDNGAEYEYTYLDRNGDYRPYQKYKLGNEIFSNYEYRKVEMWCVFDFGDNDYRTFKDDTNCAVPCVFEGTKEECEKWIEEHTKTWLKKTLNEKRKSSTKYTHTELDMYELGFENGIIEVCQKILEEVYNYSYPTHDPINDEDGPLVVELGDLREIIEKLGVEL